MLISRYPRNVWERCIYFRTAFFPKGVLRKLLAVSLVLLAFACLETALAVDYVILAGGHTNAGTPWGAWGPTQPTSGAQTVYLVLWKNSVTLSLTSWAVLGVTFFRRGTSREWRRFGFDKEVFNLMVVMRGARSRLRLLTFLNQPMHRAELSELSGLDWKEVDRELGLLQRFGLVTLEAESGSVKIYKLNEQGKLIIKLIEELRKKAQIDELTP